MKLQSIFQDEDIKYGEIFDAKVKIENEQIVVEIENENVHSTHYYKTFAGLNEDWKDYEEPNEYWCIGPCCVVVNDIDDGLVVDKKRKEIGNYFETEEEAEKAVEKLKAWKRLKNGGFKFKGYYLGLGGNFSIKFETGTKCNTKDLDFLFGGEK
jgi:hypothetical protein